MKKGQARKVEGPQLSRVQARARARDRARTYRHRLELRAERKLARETHDARMREKYGPRGRPAPVTVKTVKEI
jgi:phosphopantetheinyl transferase